jgi:5-methylcytosine-specific restriction endonuclease McrA
MSYSISDSDFETAVKESLSIREALQKLGLAPKGGNYSTFNNRVKKLNLDTSHFTGQLWNKGKTLKPKREIQDYLTNKQSIQSHKLRLRLIAEGIFEAKCYKCNNTTWLGQPIALELDHINGDHEDNSLSNLILLCPNCHAQTETYRGKNKPKIEKPAKVFIKAEKETCSDCGVIVYRHAKRCRACNNKLRAANPITKLTWPSIEQLNEMLLTMSYVELGKKLGVSDNAIRKHIKRYS